MALAKLDNTEFQKIVLVTNSSTNYVTKDGETKQREPKTAALSMIQEAAVVAGYNVGSVTASFKQYGKWENYFVNKNQETGTITLRPTKEPNNRENFVYVNPVTTQDGRSFYAFNERSEVGKNFVQGLSTKEWQRDKNSEMLKYVEGRVTLKNDDLQSALKEKGQGFIAVLSKDGIEIRSEADLKKGAQEVQNVVGKEIESAEKEKYRSSNLEQREGRTNRSKNELEMA